MKRLFIDGLSGMTHGLFVTLILGTIAQQIGLWIGGYYGNLIYMVGELATALMGAGIGVGVARKFSADLLVAVSGAVCGMIGAQASRILAGSLLTSGNVLLKGAGDPLGAFLAAYVAIEIGCLLSRKTRFDLILTPVAAILVGTVVGLLVAPPISRLMSWLGSLISWGTKQHPFIMGIAVAVLMCMMATLPLNVVAITVSLNLTGLAAGAATIGCCCSMLGFAVASFRENGFAGLIAQGIGTSVLQISNVIKKPLIWMPTVLSSAILGPVSTMLLHMNNTATGAGIGNLALLGPILTWQTMVPYEDPILVLVKIFVMLIILPAVLTLAFAELMRKGNWIRYGDMKLDI